jgi:hypothetical protein
MGTTREDVEYKPIPYLDYYGNEISIGDYVLHFFVDRKYLTLRKMWVTAYAESQIKLQEDPESVYPPPSYVRPDRVVIIKKLGEGIV